MSLGNLVAELHHRPWPCKAPLARLLVAAFSAASFVRSGSLRALARFATSRSERFTENGSPTLRFT